MGIDILSALAPLPGFGPKNFGYFAEGSSNAREIPIFGSEGVVSEVLNGKRPLNSRHILRLAFTVAAVRYFAHKALLVPGHFRHARF
ncbi:MAG: hypothetical protein DMG38_17870 [Acidobacteria bacterium]|nr:MAG: hypothetical protein DMG38_17870 [Acidobacteriota bacterium]